MGGKSLTVDSDGGPATGSVAFGYDPEQQQTIVSCETYIPSFGTTASYSVTSLTNDQAFRDQGGDPSTFSALAGGVKILGIGASADVQSFPNDPGRVAVSWSASAVAGVSNVLTIDYLDANGNLQWPAFRSGDATYNVSLSPYTAEFLT